MENINWKNQNSKSTYLHFTQHQSLREKEQGPGLEDWEQMSSCWIGGVANVAERAKNLVGKYSTNLSTAPL